MPIQPIGDRILIEQFKKEVGPIIIEDEDNLKLPKGKIVALGFSGLQQEGIAVGDVVYFNELAGERIKEGDNEYLVIRSGDIIAKEIC